LKASVARARGRSRRADAVGGACKALRCRGVAVRASVACCQHRPVLALRTVLLPHSESRSKTRTDAWRAGGAVGACCAGGASQGHTRTGQRKSGQTQARRRGYATRAARWTAGAVDRVGQAVCPHQARCSSRPLGALMLGPPRRHAHWFKNRPRTVALEGCAHAGRVVTSVADARRRIDTTAAERWARRACRCPNTAERARKTRWWSSRPPS
jgi:hypothetical protein